MSTEDTAQPATSTSTPSRRTKEDDLHQVMVDQWGHRGEYTRGQIIRRGDLDPAHYDFEHALRMGVLRPLSEAEARSWPTTTDPNLTRAEQAAMRLNAGVPDTLPETVTGEQGQAEAEEFAKPTVPYSGPNAPSPRPVRVRKVDEVG